MRPGERFVRRAGAVVAALSVAGATWECASSPQTLPAAPQLLIYIDTDAVLPNSVPGRQGPLVAPPLFDTLVIEGVHDGKTCRPCRRDLAVFEESFASGSVSFGVLAPVTAGDSIRVRLFPSAFATADAQLSQATVDVTAELPPLPSQGTSELTLFLATDDVGTPRRGTLMSGRPSPSKVGTWAPAKRVDCPAPAASGEVCAPGGAFWMGNPLVSHIGIEDGDRLRLVSLAPFYVDAKEVTAAEYRPALGALGVSAYGTGQLGCDTNDYCTLLPGAGPTDDYPMNCVDPTKAAGFCRMKGKELVTEAQYEYLASGLGQGSLYVWGDDVPTCPDAVLARSGAGGFFGFPYDCLGEVPTGIACSGRIAGGLTVGGPSVGGSGKRDALTIALPSSTGTVYDLVGNVGELARDDWSLLTGPCWSRSGVYADPVCVTDAGAGAVRGGDWTAEPVGARAAVRDVLYDGTYSPQIGFRCARAAVQ
jgi:formylglycine-generating enzyme required for sulfatase activity